MPIAFMCVLPHDQSSNLLKYIEPYIDVSSRLIMSMETSTTSHIETEGQHFHFFADMDEEKYKNFSTKYFVRKYKLNGKAKDGKPRQYGKVKEIKNEDRMISYTLKSKDLNNIYFKNFDLKTIEQYMQESFQKEEKKDFKTELMTYLCIHRDNFYHIDEDDDYFHSKLDFQKIEKAIIQYYIDKEIYKPVSRPQVKAWTTTFLMYYLNADIQDIHFYIMR